LLYKTFSDFRDILEAVSNFAKNWSKTPYLTLRESSITHPDKDRCNNFIRTINNSVNVKFDTDHTEIAINIAMFGLEY
jgi:hypothetical protein